MPPYGTKLKIKNLLLNYHTKDNKVIFIVAISIPLILTTDYFRLIEDIKSLYSETIIKASLSPHLEDFYIKHSFQIGYVFISVFLETQLLEAQIISLKNVKKLESGTIPELTEMAVIHDKKEKRKIKYSNNRSGD